ncbi:MAG: flavohemoglobin expression-modulating QEGLA motif protein [Legionellaceae bacterium]|nr:flavohemoglobin expression-modulating QEGLA motif protein [Legionellaceae bacterium]
MAEQAHEREIIQKLSARLKKAQHKIRILDCIKWDDTISKQFFKHKGKRLPAVNAAYYKKHPLPFDPAEKKEEFRGILRDAENQLGEYNPATRLIKRQCEEYIQTVYMLKHRGTPIFSELSKALYGSPDDVFYSSGPKLSEMGEILFDTLTALDVQLQSDADIKQYTPDEAQQLLQKRLSKFFTHHKDKITVMVNDGMVADAAAGADNIKLSRQATFSDRDLKYLEVHEGWVHVGTTFNGDSQPYCSFLAKGPPSTSVIQEGLAVLTEVVTFSSYPGRMRKITNRVVALDKISQGADFMDVYHYFLECGLEEGESYRHSVRLFRGSTPSGGAFTKDLSYAKGFILIYNFIRFAISQHRVDIVPLLFSGKLVLDDIPLLRELNEYYLLTPPMYLPPPFRDLSALGAWMSMSLFLNKFDLSRIQKDFQFLLR